MSGASAVRLLQLAKKGQYQQLQARGLLTSELI
jgi:hypothetical protein